MTDQAPKKVAFKSSKRIMERANFYVDANTVKILDTLINEVNEIENRSAAIRYLARWYEMTSHGREA